MIYKWMRLLVFIVGSCDLAYAMEIDSVVKPQSRIVEINNHTVCFVPRMPITTAYTSPGLEKDEMALLWVPDNSRRLLDVKWESRKLIGWKPNIIWNSEMAEVDGEEDFNILTLKQSSFSNTQVYASTVALSPQDNNLLSISRMLIMRRSDSKYIRLLGEINFQEGYLKNFGIDGAEKIVVTFSYPGYK